MQLKFLLLVFIFFTLAISEDPETPCKVPDPPIGPYATPKSYQPIVQKLIKMIDNNSIWLSNFSEAIKTARKTGVSEMDNIKNLTDYYNFLNHFVLWMPTEDETGTFVYRMLCTMYFVLDQPSVLPYQSPIRPPSCSFSSMTELTELSQWMVDFAKTTGKFLDTPQSINDTTLRTYYTAQNFNLDGYVKPEGGWRSFNDFFARKFLPGTRPIDRPNNTLVIVSAADSTFDGCWNIRNDSTVILKGLPWSIEQLLKDSMYGEKFANGKFMHAFLGPADYHRQHAPVDGTVLEARVIPGLVYLNVTVKEDPKNPEGKLKLAPIRNMEASNSNSIEEKTVEAPDDAGYQFCQARGLIVIDSPIGLVAVLPIGMAQVSSVVLSVEKGDILKKGDEISYFQFGGSDIVLVFQEKSKVDVLANIGRHYRVGEQIAISHIYDNSTSPKGPNV